jgi:hypothetical protein
MGRYWAAQWYLARARGERFRGCRAKRLYLYLPKAYGQNTTKAEHNVGVDAAAIKTDLKTRYLRRQRSTIPQMETKQP